MAAALKYHNDYPTPLLHLTYLLQQSSDELLESQTGAGLSAVRIMSTLHSSVPHSQQHVASVLKQTEANVSRQLQNMKKQGLVSITKNKKDSRQRDVTLTAKGNRTYAKAKKILDKHQKSLLGKKDTQSLERLINNI